MNAGERYDFVLEANQYPKNYWIRYRGIGDCDKDNAKVSEVAVLHYNQVKNSEPTGSINYNDSYRPGTVINKFFKTHSKQVKQYYNSISFFFLI